MDAHPARERQGRTLRVASAAAVDRAAVGGLGRDPPIARQSRVGLRTQDAAVVLGNVGTVEDRPTLEQALGDPEPLVRSHAAWALGRLRSPSAVERLRTHLRTEPDPGVRFRAEIESALQAVAC